MSKNLKIFLGISYLIILFAFLYFIFTGIEISKLNDLIDEENKLNPLDDGKIANLLNKKGISIARRTIAKYREELNYPVARLRKEI